MLRILIVFLIACSLFSCKKESEKIDQPINSWTFTAAGTVYEGDLIWDAAIYTSPQVTDFYRFGMNGFRRISKDMYTYEAFILGFSLRDTTFTVKNYQTGIANNQVNDAFHFKYGLSADGEVFFESSNLHPGPIMDYVIESYEPSTRILVITFSGEAIDASNNRVPITNGKVTCRVINR